ncbi:ATP-binding cassette domain-containing protein [Marinobacterium arenosum]|uniref:ATP-binding cassette domain-containing protein n=1 Tax=Marinobacterium arenosum TaxID=2862496 RepID=UPI001C94F6A2|nr:ATP-binding cassette domain-containing protein [Marinobacterium arenosum]MBY4675515.1 ATP-binding cassette domain-containing protein [Marinobacterium arenosum]
MILLQQVSLHRGPLAILEQADLTIHQGWKVGLIGANGAGKSTLFSMILGQLQPDGGDFQLPSQLRIAHMAQEVDASERRAVDYVLDGDELLRQVQHQLTVAEAADDAHRIAELHAKLEDLHGYSAESRARQLLAGLGFSEADGDKPVRAFSGGWRIRLNLARALMCPSDLLLLDEPTNHLDLDATIWLEQWLRQYPGTLLLISHDRDFLDSVVGHVAHLHQRKLELYKGNYTAFELLRAERLAQQQAQFQKQQQRVAEIESFVRRFRAKASKAKQAQSRLKELERMERIAPAHIDSPFRFTFQSSDKVSNPLLTFEKADCGYTDKAILRELNINLAPGARIGLLGPNGAGKSTLIKSLVGDQPLLAGVRHDGEHLRVGYFAQHQLEALDLEASPALHLQRLAPKASDQEIRTYLGAFGFHGDDALEPVKRFSGGEKARVALALIAWQKPNLLLLDEPTNHLDLEVRHALTLALQGFEGALILVSHDRNLLRNTVDEFWLVANGTVEPFNGDLNDYQSWLLEQRRNERKAEQPAETERENRSLSAAERKEQKRQQAAQRAKLRPLKQAVEKLEAQLEQVQNALAEVEQSLAEPSIYDDSNKLKLKDLLAEQAKYSKQVDSIEADWLEQLEALEELEAQLAEEG